MTRDRVRAQQQTPAAAGPRLVKVTVTAIADQTVTVTLPGGASVTGPRVAGCTYTVGGTAYTILQQPGVGPVHPIGTEIVPQVPTSTFGAFDFTGTTCSNQGNISEIGRYGDTVTINAYINVGSNAAAAGTAIGRLPAGFRPKNSRASVWAIWSNAAWKGSAAVEVTTDGNITVKWVSTTVNANEGIFGSITFFGA